MNCRVKARKASAKRLVPKQFRYRLRPYPGTEFYEHAKNNNLISVGSMTDEVAHRLPKVIIPNWKRLLLSIGSERFYGEYYFRRRVIWRAVRKAAFDSEERKGLAKQTREKPGQRSGTASNRQLGALPPRYSEKIVTRVLSQDAH